MLFIKAIRFIYRTVWLYPGPLGMTLVLFTLAWEFSCFLLVYLSQGPINCSSYSEGVDPIKYNMGMIGLVLIMVSVIRQLVKESQR